MWHLRHSRTRGPREWARSLAAVVDLALPPRCPGCGTARVPRGGAGPRGPGDGDDPPSVPAVLCASCAAGWRVRPRRAEPQPVPVGFPPTWCVAEYAGPVRRAILAHKEAGRGGVTSTLAAALAPALTAAAAATGSGPDGPLLPVLVVPVPSSGRARRLRRDDPVFRLAAAACRIARREGVALTLLRGLRHGREVADQSGLTAGQRRDNLTGALEVRGGMVARLRGSPVVVVDDILTTGATLTESARALRAQGAGVISAAVVAATVRTSGKSGRLDAEGDRWNL